MKKNSKKEQQQPFALVGQAVASSRTTKKMSQRDLAAALEISTSTLGLIERGQRRPSREVLVMIFSIFKMNQEIRGQLWTLCGFEFEDAEDARAEAEEFDHYHLDDMSDLSQPKVRTATMAVLPMPVPILNEQIMYTDSAHVVVNNFGVVVEFKQASTDGKTNINIARIGMSKEHAASLVNILTDTINKLNNPDKVR
jgi:transcriptional regulator with XRE-family HTH domain